MKRPNVKKLVADSDLQGLYEALCDYVRDPFFITGSKCKGGTLTVTFRIDPDARNDAIEAYHWQEDEEDELQMRMFEKAEPADG